MNDLISRQALHERINETVNEGLIFSGMTIAEFIEALIDSMPSAERKRGEWIVDDEYIDCSCCRHEKWSRMPYEQLVSKFRFCPNCGADMRGEE